MPDRLTPVATTETSDACGSWVFRLALVVFTLTPVVGYLAPLGLWATWAILGLAVLVEGLIKCQCPLIGGLSALWGRPLSWFLLIPALGLLTAPWSLLPGLSAVRSIGLAGQMIAALAVVGWMWRLSPQCRRWVVAIMGLSATAMGAIMVADVALGAPLAVLLHGDSPYVISGGSASRGAVLHALLLFPGAAGLWLLSYRKTALVLLLAGLWVVGQNTSNSASLGTYGGLAVGVILALLPRLRVLLAPLAILVTVAMPFAVPTLHSLAYCPTITAAPSIAHRLAIWETVRGLIPENPLFGWGVDSARAAPGGKEQLELRACDDNGQPTGKVEVRGEALPLHPHNGAMDIWFSLGLAGALAISWALYRAFAGANRHCPGRLGAATLGATSSIIFAAALLGYGLWQGWFAAALCLSVSSLALLMCPKTETERTDHGRDPD